MMLRSALLALFVALAGGCDLKDSRCDPPEPHYCLVLCCDPVCTNAGTRNSCSNVGYECQLPDSRCTCGSDRIWHCTDDPAPPDLSVHLVADMARRPTD
jgi:hypothetical protein